jgi:putative Holliday junction resolvase
MLFDATSQSIGTISQGDMRVLGIDLGERRVGLAVSDPTGSIAQPLPTLRRRAGKRMPLTTLQTLAEQYDVQGIVMGLPLAPSGHDTNWTRTVREAANKLEVRSGRPVYLVDERYTSKAAERAVRGLGLPKKKREEKGRVDAAAAVLILQSWLDARARP